MKSIEAVEAGWRGRFPDRPSSNWAELSGLAQQRAATELAWIGEDTGLGLELLHELTAGPRASLRSISDRTTAHLLAHDGHDVIAEHGALDAGLIAQVFSEGGGLLLEHAEYDSQLLNAFCGQLAVASSSVVSSVALVGGEPTRVFGKWVRSSVVVPVDAPIIVHPEGDSPFDVLPGQSVRVDGFPRIGSDSSALTLLLVEHDFTPTLRKSFLLDRASAHPYLRVDAPLNIDDPTEIYGQTSPIAYRDLIRTEFDGLLSNSGDDSLRWWWTLAQTLPEMPRQRNPGEIVRGRFPGGVGVIETEEGTLVRAGGRTLRVPEERMGLFERLLTREPIAVDDEDLDDLTLETLRVAGVLEMSLAQTPTSISASPEHTKGDSIPTETEADGVALAVSPPTRLSIMVEGAPLEVSLGHDLADEPRTLIMGVVSGYAQATDSPVASLLVTGSGPFSLVGSTLTDQPVPVELGTPPYDEPFPTDRADHLAYAVSDWIDRTALLFGQHESARLHASAFVDEERVWVVAGESNAGKSSLVLDAVQRGASYITEERVTIHGTEGQPTITGLAQAIRMRSEEPLVSMEAVAHVEHGTSSDGFRWLLFGEAIGQLAPICRDRVAVTDILVLSPEPPAVATHGWVVRALAELSHNLSLAGVDGLLELARLACDAQLYVRPERSVSSVEELHEPDLTPTDYIPELLVHASGAEGNVKIAPGVVTVSLGDELLLWIPRDSSLLLQLRESGAEWWRALVEGQPVSAEGEFHGFVQTLRSAGAVE